MALLRHPLPLLRGALFGLCLLALGLRAWSAPMARGVHPRLLVGPEDLPGLQSRLATPFGRKVEQRLDSLLDQPCAPWLATQQAAGWALRYALAGDARSAAKALQLCRQGPASPGLNPVANYGEPPPSDVVARASRITGLALAYDLARSGWSETDRREVASQLLGYALNPILPASRLARNPAGADMVLSAAASGLAALAIADDPGVPAEAFQAAVEARNQVVAYLEATGRRGWPREGFDQLRIPLGQGLGAFLIAWRRCQGEDLTALPAVRGWPSLYATLLVRPDPARRADGPDLPFFGLPPHRPGAGPTPRWLRGPLAGGDIAALLALSDAGSRASLLWTYTACFGDGGDGSLDITKPTDALLVLLGIPTDETPAAPDTLISRTWFDEAQGLFLFRNAWKDHLDAVAAITANARPAPGLATFGDAGSFRLLALGGRWAVQRARDAADLDAPAREREDVVVIPGTHGWLAGRVLRAASLPDGSGSVSLNLDAVYSVAPTSPRSPLLEPTQDIGIRALRAMTVDYSGECGAPVLLAIADHITGAPTRRWLMHTEERDIRLLPDGFELRAANGATLKATILSPARHRIRVEQGEWTDTLGIDSDGDFFVIMTVVGPGATQPSVQVSGTGLDARARVGGCTVYFDGRNVAIQ